MYSVYIYIAAIQSTYLHLDMIRSVIFDSLPESSLHMFNAGTHVLCRDDPVNVAHIIARKAGDVGQVSELAL